MRTVAKMIDSCRREGMGVQIRSRAIAGQEDEFGISGLCEDEEWWRWAAVEEGKGGTSLVEWDVICKE